MADRGKALRIGVLIAVVGGLWAPTAAQSHQVYLACDNAHASLYEIVVAHPHTCNLGLGRSIYQAQPVPGRAFAALGLRRLRWRSWGRHTASAHGLSCDIKSDGGIQRGTCDHVVVTVSRPQAIGPAGFAVIYQLIRVLHRSTRAEPYRYGYSFQPGVDY